MKILVVGGAGYIGSCFIEYVFNQTKHEVVILDDLSTGFKESIHPQATFVLGNILDKEILDTIFKKYKIDVVVHFAAKLLVGESVDEPAKYWLNNVGGVATLLEAMKNNNIKNLIFSSTAAVYGNPISLPIDENSSTKPCNPYGSSKLACETLIQEAKIAYDINYVILRYFNVAGAMNICGLRQLKPTLLIPVINRSIIEKSEMLIFGNDYPNTADGTCIRDYIHIQDLVRAHISGLEWMIDTKNSGIFNLGTSSGYSVLEVVKTAEQTLKQKVNYSIVSRRLGDPEKLLTKNDKARDILKWIPEKSMEEMIVSDYEFRKKLYK